MNKIKQNVLMVHNFYQIGGGEHTVFNNEIELLKNNGHKVITYTRDNKELNGSKLKLLLSPLSTIWSFKTYREVKQIIKNEKIDIVHCHNTFPLISPSVYYAARKMKVPVVQTIHNFRFLCPAGIFYRDGHICEQCRINQNFKSAIKHRCYRNSKIQTLIIVMMLKFHRLIGTYKKINYIFLTDFNKLKFSNLIDINGNNVFVKPNFVNRVKLNNNNKKEENKFVFYGRLEENKGIRTLLEAWKNVPKNYKLHIYGEGSLKKLVLDYEEKFSNIKYYGFKPQKEVCQDLIQSNGLIMPSELYETFGMTIAESFSLGIPAIVSNIGNPSRIVEESKGGVICNFHSSISLSDSLDKIIKNKKIYSKNAKEYYEKHFNPEKNYEELINIYEKASY